MAQLGHTHHKWQPHKPSHSLSYNPIPTPIEFNIFLILPQQGFDISMMSGILHITTVPCLCQYKYTFMFVEVMFPKCIVYFVRLHL